MSANIKCIFKNKYIIKYIYYKCKVINIFIKYTHI